MIKTLNANLGGESRSLKLGTAGLMRYAGEVYPGDPMELLFGINTIELLKSYSGNGSESPESIVTGVNNPKKLFEIIYAFIYGGLKCAGCKEEKEKIFEWVVDMDFDEGFNILKEARKSMTGKIIEDSGETKAQTQQENN